MSILIQGQLALPALGKLRAREINKPLKRGWGRTVPGLWAADRQPCVPAVWSSSPRREPPDRWPPPTLLSTLLPTPSTTPTHPTQRAPSLTLHLLGQGNKYCVLLPRGVLTSIHPLTPVQRVSVVLLLKQRKPEQMKKSNPTVGYSTVNYFFFFFKPPCVEFHVSGSVIPMWRIHVMWSLKELGAFP